MDNLKVNIELFPFRGIDLNCQRVGADSFTNAVQKITSFHSLFAFGALMLLSLMGECESFA